MFTLDLSSKTVPPISPPCPTCGKKLELIGITPTCEFTIYEYECSNDGDRLSWQPHHPKNSTPVCKQETTTY
jgi:hypothetical protein